eukprot:GHVP01023857.1.p1 GENE.GHVP01023857.1~~GHVP01023857.1.p1  ORF type:complete len:276 (-),score=35.18 GHVP01023857.1:87-914(-)
MESVVFNGGSISTSTGPLGRRHEHRMCHFKGTLWSFGGLRSDYERSESSESCPDDKWLETSVPANDLLKFENELGNWAVVPSCETSAIPFPRYGHSLTAFQNCLVVYGGQSDSQSIFGDVWSFDGSRWAQLDVGTSLSNIDVDCGLTSAHPSVGRTNHGAAGWNNKLLIFGGCTKNKWLNDLWSFDLYEKKWSKIIPRSKFVEFNVGTTPPCPRDLHVTFLFENKMWVHGGWSRGKVLGDLWSFDLINQHWQRRHLPAKKAREYARSNLFNWTSC